MLDGVGGSGSRETAVLDLLARVHAQRGDLAAADACWARVERSDPRPEAAAAAGAGRRRIAALRAGLGCAAAGAGRRIAGAALVAAAAGAVAAGTLLPRPAADPAHGADLAAVRAGQASLAAGLDELRRPGERPAPLPARRRP